MCVPGAIAATSAASVMRNPAEAARDPAGAMNTTTGARDATMRETIVRVESSSPPGRAQDEDDRHRAVRSARAMTSSTNSAAIGWMMPSYSATTTAGAGD